MRTLNLKHLTLSQFRSHEKLELAFSGKPVAIYGSNGAGKTNILEAISMLSPGRGLRRSAVDDIARQPANVGWKVRAELQSLAELHEIETGALPGASRSVRIDSKAAPQLTLGKINRVLWLIPAMDRLWIEGADNRRRFLDRAVMSLFPSHAEISLNYDKAMRERNRLLKDMVRDAHWYQALELRLAECGVQIMANRAQVVDRLAQAQTRDDQNFPFASLTLMQADNTQLPDTADAYAEHLANGRSADLAAGRTLIGPHRSDLHAVYEDKKTDARICSTGEQKALLISLVLANAKAIAQDFGAPPLLLLDEVAAHLDIDRRAALYGAIVALGVQAFMTGTGEELFEPLQEEADFICVSDVDGTSQVTQVTQV
jgi:DNA replication and repair protein RecF